MIKKRVTSFDVARRAGVSRSVVSAVLNGTQGIGVSSEKREAVLEAIRELNYHVDAQARGMKTGKSQCIAAFGDTRSTMFLQVLEGLQIVCSEHNYHILISGRTESEEDRSGLIDLYYQKRIDGIVSFDKIGEQNNGWAEQLHKSQIPFVSIEGFAEDARLASVLVNYKKSVADALQYMAEHTEATPIYVRLYAISLEHTDNWAERDRQEAYLDWCEHKGVAPRILECEQSDEAGLQRWIEQLAQEEAPIPPLLFNWSIGAVNAYRAAHKLGLRIGRDLRLMAADNAIRASRLMIPELATMEIPYAQLGEQAARLLIGQINEPSAAIREKLSTLWNEAKLLPGESLQQ